MSDPRHTAAERLLSTATGFDVTVVGVEELAHARGSVSRLALDRAIPGVGSTIIVKRRDPASDLGAFAATNLRSEGAVLKLLGDGADVAPRVIAGGDDDGMLLLTDVGHCTVESILFGDDYAQAGAALEALARTTAILHRTAVDVDALAGLGTWTIATRESGWRTVVDAVTELELPPAGPGAAEEQLHLLAELRSPGPATALVHGDLGPNNAVVDAGHCRLVDFEGSGFQHVGLDIAMLRFPFAWFGRWALVPSDVQFTMEAAYRRDAGREPAAIDDAVAVGCMAMTLLRLERLPRIAAADQPAPVALRRRTQIMSTMEVTVDAANHVERFPALSGWLGELADAMRARWVEATQPAPVYPAFGKRDGHR